MMAIQRGARAWREEGRPMQNILRLPLSACCATRTPVPSQGEREMESPMQKRATSARGARLRPGGGVGASRSAHVDAGRPTRTCAAGRTPSAQHARGRGPDARPRRPGTAPGGAPGRIGLQAAVAVLPATPRLCRSGPERQATAKTGSWRGPIERGLTRHGVTRGAWRRRHYCAPAHAKP